MSKADFIQVVNRLILRRDWARVRYYSKRVRVWLAEDLSYIDEPLVDHLSFGRGVEYILPNMKHLELHARTVSSIHLQTLLLSPSLEYVLVRNVDPTVKLSSSMTTFFLTLADVASESLKHLDVQWVSQVPTETFVDGLTDLFSHPLEQLASVSLRSPRCIDAKGFRALSCLPALTKLHLNLRQIHNIYDFISPLPSASRASIPFANLRDLYLLGEPSTFIRILLFLGPSPGMVSLGFGVQHYPQSRDLSQLFEVVASKFPSLATLQFNTLMSEENDIISSNRLYRDSFELYFHDLSIISSLLALDRLVALHLEFGVPMQLGDDDMETIGHSLPNIKMLNLCSNPVCGRSTQLMPVPSAPTLEGLFALTKSCTALEHVGLYLDVTRAADAYEAMIPSTPIVSETLSLLNVGYSRAGPQPAAVAALLGAAYPNLGSFQWAGAIGQEKKSNLRIALMEEPARGWRQVAELNRLFRAVRANERMRASAEAGAAIPTPRPASHAHFESMVID